MSTLRNVQNNLHDDLKSGKPVTITPDMAMEMLDKQPKNRNVRLQMVDQLLRAFERGEVICHPSMAIMVDQYGRVIDGQHRLRAIVAYGRPVKLWMVMVDKPVLEAFHNCLPRTSADGLAINHGVKNCHVVAAVARLVHFRVNNTLVSTGVLREQRLTPGEMLAVYEKFDVDHNVVIEEAVRIYKASLLPVSATHIGYLLFQDMGISEWIVSLLTDEGIKTQSQLAVRRLLVGKHKHRLGKVVLMTKAYNNPNLTKFYTDGPVPDITGGKFEGLYT
jgi:hypothetical protein